MHERYELAQKRFYIIDQELSLHLEGALEDLRLCKEHYENGALKHEAYYLKDQLHGPSTFFSREGTLLSETWFFLGEKQGKVRKYYSSKALYSIERYRDGLFEGKQEYYYDNGLLKTLLHYEKGLLHGETLLYWPSGSLKRKCLFLLGQKKGWDRIWDEEGKLIEEEEYEPISVFKEHVF